MHVVIHALLVEYGTDELGVDKFKDPDWLRSTEKTFAKHTGGAIRNCVFAIDGMAVKIQKPTPKECSNPMSYWCRKGFFSVVLQAMCDGDSRFTWASMKCAGSTHDSTSFCVTELAR